MKLSNQVRPVAIVGGLRTPFCRAGGDLQGYSPLDLLGENLRALAKKFDLIGKKVDDVALGTVFFPPSLWNMAREAVFLSKLAPETPAVGIQRACATSLESAIWIAQKIALGKIEVGIAGGVESISNVALYHHPKLARRIVRSSQARTMGARLSAWKGLSIGELKPQAPVTVEVTTKMSMGEHCELMAKEWHISRKDQDELSLRSHQNGARAYAEGFYADLIAPVGTVEKDSILRSDTSLEKLAKLKPAFDRSDSGTLTAGNSSPLTDGAASVLLASEEWAREHRFPVLAYLTDFETMAIDPTREGLLMAPAYAVGKMLQRRGEALQKFDFYEIHEAFAAQVLCTLKAWESADFCKNKIGLPSALGSVTREKLNVVGGSVALGHPFGATGARLLASLGKLLDKKGSGRGLISICTGGGMGSAAILER